MLITKVQLAAMERVRIPEDERRDFYLYVDEFQNFATDSFAGILSEARKYRLDLIVAHQYIGQLITDTTTKVRDAIFGNVGTLISFRVGAADAEFLEKEFAPEFDVRDLVNLENYNIYLKMMIDGVSCRPFSATTLPPMDMDVTDQREKIVKVSRERFSRSREEVEAKIAKWSGVITEEEEKETPKRKPSSKKHKTNCWACGKETETSFKPDGVRPIYCKDCLDKVKAGEDISLRFKPITQSKTEKIGQQAALGELGIEFEESGPLGIPKSRREKEIPKADVERKKIETPSAVSLDEALKKEPVSFRRKKKRTEVNLKDLRKTLEEVIGKREK
jgi:CxxC-x17-CxxC domain-containing protein